MAYSTSNPPMLQIPSIGNKPAQWVYSSTHGSTAVGAAGFFTNGKDLGMKVNDVLITIQTTGTVPVLGMVSAVSTTGATVATTA